MNEKLEQKIAGWFDTLDGYCKRTDYTIKDIKDTAQHFYNLALADVRGEMERRIKILEPHKDTFESAAACRQELIWLKDFIDNLTK